MKEATGEMRSPVKVSRTSHKDGSKFYLSGLLTLSVVPDDEQNQEPQTSQLWGMVHLERRDDDVVVIIPDFAGMSDIARSNSNIVLSDVLNSLKDVIEIRVKLAMRTEQHLEQISLTGSPFVVRFSLQFPEEFTMQTKTEGFVIGWSLESEQRPLTP
jgi:hypothetical protein